jgi:hypothetical protein
LAKEEEEKRNRVSQAIEEKSEEEKHDIKKRHVLKLFSNRQVSRGGGRISSR